jgi:hypothetical protein
MTLQRVTRLYHDGGGFLTSEVITVGAPDDAQGRPDHGKKTKIENVS